MSDDVQQLRASLWQSGYRPVAVKTGGKAPDGEAWQIRARQDPPDAVTRPATARALSTGVLCDGVRAIDIDIADPVLADRIEAAIFELIGIGPVRSRSGTGKRLVVYRAAAGDPAKRWIGSVGSKIEVLGRGQQFVGYGVHPEGMAYEWRDGADLVVTPLANLGEVTEAEITAVLNECAAIMGCQTEADREAEKARPLPSIASTGEVRDGRGRSYATEVLKRLASDLAANPKGGRNNALNDAAMRLGALSARNWLTEQECRQALLAASHSNGLAKEDGHRQCEKTFNSGFRAGLQRPAADPVAREQDDDSNVVIMLRPRNHVVRATGDIVDEATGIIVYEATAVMPDRRGVEDDMTRVPGLVGAITDWITAGARRPSRPLALAAALGIVGTMGGRRFAGPTGAATHLYIIALAVTGAGKQHPQDCAVRILKAAGKERYSGPPSFMSMSALIRFLQREPVSLCCMDEFGSFLKRVNSRRASSHEKGISEVLRNLWGLSFQPYVTPEWASVRSERVGSVSLSLVGSSTPDELIGALSGDDVSNGFLNRFLVIDGGDREAEREPLVDARLVPPALARDIAALAGTYLGTGNDPEPEIVPWGAGAKAIYDALVVESLKRIDAGPEGAYYARTAEIAVRLATIVTIGVDTRGSISKDTMAWAARLSMSCSEWIAREAESRMTEELGTAALWNKINARLKRGPLTARDAQKAFFRHVKNADDIKRLLASMEQAGVIRSYKVRPAGGGHEATYFALAG